MPLDRVASMFSNLHGLGNDLARFGTELVELGVPELNECLVAEPTLVDQQAVHLEQPGQAKHRHTPTPRITYHAAPVLIAASFLGSFDHLGRDDAAVRGGDAALLHLAGDALLDEVPQSQAHLGDLGRRHGRFEMFIAKRREHWERPLDQPGPRRHKCRIISRGRGRGRTHGLAPPDEATRDGEHRPRAGRRSPGHGQWPSSGTRWASPPPLTASRAASMGMRRQGSAGDAERDSRVATSVKMAESYERPDDDAFVARRDEEGWTKL